jgi:hypothetical protein
MKRLSWVIAVGMGNGNAEAEIEARYFTVKIEV